MSKRTWILEKILYAVNKFVLLFPIQENKITFVSLEADTLKDDLAMIREQIPAGYEVKEVLFHFRKNDLLHAFGYLINMLRQIWHINRSSLVLINDNNYVISKFKREGVKVVQVWHANGAIKKFGNCLKREYQIANYDYILANSKLWKQPYAEAFGVEEGQVKVLGLPKIDQLYNKQWHKEKEAEFYGKYPQCVDKKIILYAPTFRGNIYKGFEILAFPYEEVIESLGEEYIILYKPHPLVTDRKIAKHKNIIRVDEMDLYELFAVSDLLISDYSSIIFDYAITDKPIVYYVPDLEAYKTGVGCFVEHEDLPGVKCGTGEELVEAIKTSHTCDLGGVREKYFQYHDGNNIKRVMTFIEELM